MRVIRYTAIVAVLAWIISTAACAGTVGLWLFDGDAKDCSGLGNNVTIVAGAGYSASRPSPAGGFGFNYVGNKTLDMSTAGSYATVVYNDSLRITDGITLQAWIYPTKTTGYSRIIGQSGDRYLLRLANDCPQFLIRSGGTHTIVHAPPVDVNAWTHVAATWGTDASNGKLRIFVNGVEAQYETSYLTVPADTSGDYTVIGHMGSECFQGRIDEVKMMNRAAQVDEIQRDCAYSLHKLVGVWYLPEYTARDEYGHWAGVKSRGGAMPIYGPSSAGDPQMIRRQFKQMRECGIDFIAFDHTNTVHVNGNMIDSNIRAWFDFMDRLPESQRIPLVICAGGELNQHSNRDAWLEAVNYLYDTYASRPSYLKVNGKPVLQWYIEKDIWDDWNDDRWTIRRTYHFFRMDGQIRYGGWGFGSDQQDHTIEECLSFHPGWDLAPPGHPRAGGDFYRGRWLNALRVRPAFVFLSDWNGWIEGTAIEDSPSWTDANGVRNTSYYRQLTLGYIAAYKNKLVDGYYYKDESQTGVYRWSDKQLKLVSPYPSGKAVIVLPAGRLNSLASAGGD